MTPSQHQSSLSRAELVVLACLSQAKPPSEPALGKAIHELCHPDESPARAQAIAVAAIESLRQRMLVNESRRVLTEPGAQVLRKELGLARTPTWAEVRDRHIPALALGLPPGSDAAKVVHSQDAIVPAILSAKFGVRAARTLIAVCDALLAEAVGLPAVPTPIEQLRAHVLARRAGLDVDGKLAAIGKQIAITAVDARPGRGAFVKALAHRWMRQTAEPAGARLAYTPCQWPARQAVTPLQPEPPRAPVQVALGADYLRDQLPSEQAIRQPSMSTSPSREVATFVAAGPGTTELLDAVRETIPRVGADGRFGSEKVFVSAIWRTLERDPRLVDVSLDRFKRWLVTANRDGSLILARADLIGAMDPKQVAESEIEDRGATFHFVLDQGDGAPGSHRATHAR